MKNKEHESSNESDSLESGSWESIVLEQPDGVRREFIVKKAKKVIGDSTPTANGKKENMPILVITRAQAKANQLRESEQPSEETSECVNQTKTWERPPKQIL